MGDFIYLKDFNSKIVGELACKLCEKSTGAKPTSIQFLGEGSYGLVYKLTFEQEPKIAVFKAYKTAGMNRQEELQINTLAPNSKIPFPKLYFAFDADEDINVDFLVMEYIDGENALTHRTVLMSKSKKKVLCNAIVESMISMHAVTSDGFGFLGGEKYSTWEEFYHTITTFVKNECKKLVRNGDLKKKYYDLFALANKQFNLIFSEKVAKPSLLHGDLNLLNVMVERKSFKPLAIIDPVNSMWGDFEYDLFQTKNIIGDFAGVYKEYKKRVKTSSKIELKSAFYALTNELYCCIKSGKIVENLISEQTTALKKEMKKAKLSLK